MGDRKWGCRFRNGRQERPVIKMAFFCRVQKEMREGVLKDSTHHSIAGRIYCLTSFSALKDNSAQSSSLWAELSCNKKFLRVTGYPYLRKETKSVIGIKDP